jgi:predicted nucleotidyltransferase
MDKIRTVCDQHHVKSLFAFGAVCTDEFKDDNEIELLVSFKPLDFGDYADNYFHAVDSFEEVFHRPVDLVTDKALHNPYFTGFVHHTKKHLYGQ